MLKGPIYDGKFLHETLREKLGDTKLDGTLTNVLIPTFDIRKMQPVLFNTFEVCQCVLVVTLSFMFRI